MTRAVTLFVALTLTGLPATLACMERCARSVPADAAAACHDHAPAPPPTDHEMGAARALCGAPVIEMPFLVEATRGALAISTTQSIVGSTFVILPPAERHDMIGFLDQPADRPLPTLAISTILRI